MGNNRLIEKMSSANDETGPRRARNLEIFTRKRRLQHDRQKTVFATLVWKAQNEMNGSSKVKR